MKRLLSTIALLLLCTVASAQPVKLRFVVADCKDTVLYIGRHYRDAVQVLDSMKRDRRQPSYAIAGRRDWGRGVYALVRQDRKTVLTDFLIDDSRSFTLEGDASLSAQSVKVKGSKANTLMFDYMATLHAAQQEIKDIRERKKNPATRAQAEADEVALTQRMTVYQEKTLGSSTPNLFFELVNLCENPDVPDSVEDKARYFRTHYWDRLFNDELGMMNGERPRNENCSTFNIQHSALLYSPQLFNKMNYFFFGLLYHADADTICRELDRLMARVGDDTAMRRYVLQFIEPRYFRSTKNIGWDAVWCHIAREYYLKGLCPWSRESELYNMRQNYGRIRQSIIGAHGQELWMADTNQSSDPNDWISSHRFPTRYVILWFWDPDCHHCQEQSEELKVLYDSLQTAPDRRFEVYAVGYESDVEKWKRYVREHGFHWVNVGGSNVNIDYQEAYNVHGAPTMIILNERRDIIMNKVLPVKNLLQFLDNYEKRCKGVKE